MRCRRSPPVGGEQETASTRAPRTAPSVSITSTHTEARYSMLGLSEATASEPSVVSLPCTAHRASTRNYLY